jgi:oleate hydratase
MGSYQNMNPVKPERIETKKTYLIGGGIASLAAAEYLIQDGHFDGKNIRILKQDSIPGGALNGAGTVLSTNHIFSIDSTENNLFNQEVPGE